MAGGLPRRVVCFVFCFFFFFFVGFVVFCFRLPATRRVSAVATTAPSLGGGANNVFFWFSSLEPLRLFRTISRRPRSFVWRCDGRIFDDRSIRCQKEIEAIFFYWAVLLWHHLVGQWQLSFITYSLLSAGALLWVCFGATSFKWVLPKFDLNGPNCTGFYRVFT